MNNIMSSIDIKDYFNEKFGDLKSDIKELKAEIKDNQHDIYKRIEQIEDDLLFYRFALRYKKLFVAGVIALFLLSSFQFYQVASKIINNVKQTESSK